VVGGRCGGSGIVEVKAGSSGVAQGLFKCCFRRRFDGCSGRLPQTPLELLVLDGLVRTNFRGLVSAGAATLDQSGRTLITYPSIRNRSGSLDQKPAAWAATCQTRSASSSALSVYRNQLPENGSRRPPVAVAQHSECKSVLDAVSV
jgi:hypothetical protein